MESGVTCLQTPNHAITFFEKAILKQHFLPTVYFLLSTKHHSAWAAMETFLTPAKLHISMT